MPLLLTAVALCAAPALADGPWCVVASPTGSTVSVIDLSTGERLAEETLGTQAIGVAAVGRDLVISDFSGGLLHTFHTEPAGEVIGVEKGQVGTRPELANPEGMVPTGDATWVLVSNGGKQAAGPDVGLVLADIVSQQKLASLPFPSVYGVAWHAPTRTAVVLDGFAMQLAMAHVSPTGVMTDTGTRVPLTGTEFGPRFVALYASGTRALVTHKLDGTVEVLDLVAGESLGHVANLGTGIGAIAVTPDGTRAFVANYSSSEWAVLDLTPPDLPVDTGMRIPAPYGAPNTYIGTITFGFHDNVLLYSATDGGVVYGFDWTTYEPIADPMPAGISPAGMAVVY
jgi:DNA-binding beta-propeller fold protein YncE